MGGKIDSLEMQKNERSFLLVRMGTESATIRWNEKNYKLFQIYVWNGILLQTCS
jgi:hypothetical protein